MSIVLYATSIILLVVSVAYYIYICFQASSREQKILQFLATCMVLLNAMDTATVVSQSAESAETCLYLSYLGGDFVGFSFILLISVIAHIEIPRPLTALVIGVDTFFIGAAFTNKIHHLLYTVVEYVPLGRGHATERHLVYGPLFYVYVVWYVLMLLFPLSIIWVSAQKKPLIFNTMKKTFLFFILAGSFAFVPFFITFIYNTTFDYSPVGVTCGAVILLITIYRYRAFPMQQNSEEIILNEMDDIIIACDTHSQLIYANNSARQYFDPDNNFVYGLPLGGINPQLDTLMKIKNDEDYSCDGKTYICRILSIPDRSNKSVSGYMHWFKDVTKERRLLKEAVQLKESAEAANTAKGQFLAHMSHEIRTPINAILGMNEIIRRESEDTAIKEYSETVARSGNTLLTIVNDILDFSKIEEGKLEIVPETYDFALMLKDLIEITRARAAGKSLKVEVNVDADIPRMLYGDVVRVKQVIINVLTNAVKYTEHGSVTLIAHARKLYSDQLLLLISVKDTGMGIKPEALSKLFDRFERLDNANNQHIEGVGLGMSITRSLIDQMNGNIDVQSEYGKGSTFTLMIPQGIRGCETIGVFSEDKITSGDVKKEDHKFTASDARILIVDDNKINLRVASALLKFSKIQIDTADSGRKCLDIIRKKHYDIILLDHRMPEMSGVEVLEKIMSDSTHMCVNVPVIAMTADAGPAASIFFMEKGFTDYISKPLIPNDYEQLILKYLPEELVTI